MEAQSNNNANGHGELPKLYKQLSTLKEVAVTYPHHSIDNVIQQLTSRIKELEKL